MQTSSSTQLRGYLLITCNRQFTIARVNSDYYFTAVQWVNDGGGIGGNHEIGDDKSAGTSAAEVCVVWLNRAQNTSVTTLCKSPMWMCQEVRIFRSPSARSECSRCLFTWPQIVLFPFKKGPPKVAQIQYRCFIFRNNLVFGASFRNFERRPTYNLCKRTIFRTRYLSFSMAVFLPLANDYID